MKPATNHAIRVAVLVNHEPSVQTLWLLVRLASRPHVSLLCFAPQRDDEWQDGRWTRRSTRRLTARFREKQQHLLDELFDGPSLRRWWRDEASVVTGFPSLDHPHAVPGIAAFEPGVIVFLRQIGPAGSLAERSDRRVLAARIGDRPVEHAMDAVVRAIAHERPELLESAIYAVDDADGAERCLWARRPQVAPGDSGETILLKMAVELGDALALRVRDVPGETEAASDAPLIQRRSPPAIGLRTWLSYMRFAGGRHARWVYERAVRC